MSFLKFSFFFLSKYKIAFAPLSSTQVGLCVTDVSFFGYVCYFYVILLVKITQRSLTKTSGTTQLADAIYIVLLGW